MPQCVIQVKIDVNKQNDFTHLKATGFWKPVKSRAGVNIKLTIFPINSIYHTHRKFPLLFIFAFKGASAKLLHPEILRAAPLYGFFRP